VAGLVRWMMRLGLAAVLAAGLGFLPYRTASPSGIRRVLDLKRDLRGIIDDNRALAADNERLLKQIRRLRSGQRAIERVARDDLGLVRSDDLIFIFE
jgi:cell division protein FtsB